MPASMPWGLQSARVDTQGRWLEPCLEGKSYFQERVSENESRSTERCRVASLEPGAQLPKTGWVQSQLEPWGSAKAGNASS